MTIADDYINRVIDRMPVGTPLRQQIAMELRGHIAERQEHGQSIEDVVRQLGDAEVLAESYLSSVPLVSAGFLRRVAAKCLDGLATLSVAAAVPAVVWAVALPRWEYAPVSFASMFILNALLFPLYTMVAEHRWGATAGKRLLGLRVVQESGARIGFGQSVLRQIPFFFQIFVLDVLFALFTTHHQRAFELVSKTRVVRVSKESAS
jgi:uncharacterized RDD family membrane protein YckC